MDNGCIRDEMMREKQNRSSRSMERDVIATTKNKPKGKASVIKQNQLMQAERELQRTREEKSYCLKNGIPRDG